MSRHLLLTAWAFPPARTSGVYRAAGIATAFRNAGWDVTVLCGPARLFIDNQVADPSLSDALAPGIEVQEIPLEHHELSTDLRRRSWLRARHPEIWAKRRLRRDRAQFPEVWYGSWAPALRTAATRVHARHPVSLSLGTAAPAVDFVPGAQLWQRAGVPYVLDYRDAWTFRTFTGLPPDDLDPTVDATERRLMRDAARVWFVNDPIRRWHARKYPDAAERMRTVRNGFDLPVGTTDPAGLAVPARPGQPGLTFGYIGTINHGAFPWDAVVDGWRRALPDLPSGSRLVLRGHLGRSADGSSELRTALADAEQWGVIYEGPVARDRVWEVYRGFDALVLALPSGPGVTSGKVYEYAPTGLPIVSVHTTDTPVGEVLGDHPAWHPPASIDPGDVARAFLAAAAQVASMSSTQRAAAARHGARWERQALLAPAVADLERMLDERGRA